MSQIVFLKLKFITIVIMLYNPLSGMAVDFKQLYAYHFNKEDGLPANEVYDILQDQNGFIWLATESGLIRYDGNRFFSYRNKNQNYLPGSSLREDRMGRIWYENFDGHLFYAYQDSLYWLQSEVFNFNAITINNQFLIKLQVQQIDLYDIESLQIVKQLSINDKHIVSAGSSTKEQNFYVFSQNSLFQIDTNGSFSKSKKIDIENFKIRNLMPAGKYLLLVNSNKNGKKYEWLDRDLNSVKFNSKVENLNINGFLHLNNEYWILAESGAYRFNENGRFINRYFPNLKISKVIQDFQGNYWFTTLDEGVFIAESFDNEILPTRDKEFKFIFAYRNKYILIDKKGNIYKYALDKPFKFDLLYSTNSSIYYAFVDEERDILYTSASGLGSTLYHLDTADSHTYNIAIKAVCTMNTCFNAIASNGFIAVQQLSMDSNCTNDWSEKWTNTDANNSIKSIYGNNVRGRSIAFSPLLNTMYFSGNTGTYETTAGGFFEMKYQGESIFAKHLFAVDSSLFLITTADKLLYRNAHLSWLDLSEKFGLNAENIWLAKADSKYIHFLTSEHLYQLDRGDLTLKPLPIHINPRKINDFITVNDTLILLTSQGIIIKNIDRISTSLRYQPSFYINYVSINGIKKDYSKTLEIPYYARSILIDFSIPDFLHSNQQTFSYQIDGNNWQAASLEFGKLEIHELPEGKHTIRFKVGNNLQATQIKIDVLIPFWRQWWFIITTLIIAMWTSLLIYKKRVAQFNRQIALLQAKVKLEQELGRSIVKSVKAQMNPHFFYNALNTIQAYIYINDKKNASLYLSKFSKLTRIILEMTEKEIISAREEVDALRLYLELEKMRFASNMEYSINIAPNIDLDFLKMPPMLVQPYVENAVKHGLLHKKEGQKKLSISFTMLQNHFLQIEISDNGIGRKRAGELNKLKNKNHQSFAIDANNSRINAVNNLRDAKISISIIDLYNSMEEPAGTQVKIIIPLTNL